MKKTFLVLGIVCASLLVVAQADSQASRNGQADGAGAPDVATGQASGEPMQAPASNAEPTASEQSVITARESGTGLATGKSAQSPTGTHHDGVIHRDLAARETASGQASGQADIQSPRLTGTGLATGKIRESPSKASLGKTTAVDDWNAKNNNGMSGAQSNPMYKDKGMSGTNPLYEQDTQRVTKSRSNIQNNRVATGDVDGDGVADAVVKSKSNITNNRVATGDVNGDGGSDVSVPPSNPAQMKGDYSRGHQPDRKANDGSNKNAAPRDAATGQASGKRQHN